MEIKEVNDIPEITGIPNGDVMSDTDDGTNIFGKISGDRYKGLIEGYQTKKGKEFSKWYDNLQNEEKIFLSSMFD